MRHPAAHGRTDSCHSSVGEALRAIGLRPMDLSRAGDGVEDWLVPLMRTRPGDHGYPWDLIAQEIRWWLLIECKTAKNKRGEATLSQFTKAQIEWREQTQGWPRITVTSAQQAVDLIREMTA